MNLRKDHYQKLVCGETLTRRFADVLFPGVALVGLAYLGGARERLMGPGTVLGLEERADG